MVYKDQFVATVKCGGRILRERDGKVVLPFGAEYSILLRNLSTRKASIKVSIDGKDVLDGKSLIVESNASMDLERFIDDSLDSGNRFKFIRKTQEIVDHRGHRIDDGIIIVEFAFEQTIRNVITTTEHHHYDHYHDHCHHYDRWSWYPYYQTYWYGPLQSTGVQYASNSENEIRCCSAQLNALSAPLPDEGITVKGSESQQHFHQGWIGQLDPSEVIIIRLVGEDTKGIPISEPITVKDKFTCSSCGRASDSTVQFCGNCGTALMNF